jgi:hypothetical protein
VKTLETVKIWTGDGLGSAAAVTLTQLKRTDTVALYQRTQKNGQPGGYEVFIVNIIKAGTPLPGGGVVEESYEQYPTANRFGRIAWAPGSLARAEKIYANLLEGRKPGDGDGVEDDEVEPSNEPKVKRVKKELTNLTLPNMSFTVNELAEQNKVDYPIAFQFIKLAITENKVKFIRTERRNAKGKESNIYEKV